jgi:hypothetical protein
MATASVKSEPKSNFARCAADVSGRWLPQAFAPIYCDRAIAAITDAVRGRRSELEAVDKFGSSWLFAGERRQSTGLV